MAANIDLIADSLDQNSPALRDVMTPDEPAAAKVLRIPIRRQLVRLGTRVSQRIRVILRK